LHDTIEDTDTTEEELRGLFGNEVTGNYGLDIKWIFTTLHGMQTWSYNENSVCPSVKRVHCDKTKEKFVQIFIPYERSFILVF